jgi:type IV secretory pathway VirB2 component (pilin)
MDWTKFLSREFMVAVAAIIIASIALFTNKAGFVEWAAAVGGFVALFSGTQTIQKVKANGS